MRDPLGIALEIASEAGRPAAWEMDLQPWALSTGSLVASNRVLHLELPGVLRQARHEA
jgi:hypothetical protein